MKSGLLTLKILLEMSKERVSETVYDYFGARYLLSELGNFISSDRAQGTVMIVNDNAVYYDWNLGGGSQRDTYIRVNNALFNPLAELI